MLATLLELVGDDNTITVHKAIVAFTGNYESAMLLEQLMYWSSGRTRIPGGWISKSVAQWGDEIYLSRRKIEKARKHLIEMGVLETKLKRFNNAVTMHYRLNKDGLAEKWAQYVEDVQNAKSDLYETPSLDVQNAKSLTETTA